MSHFQKHLNKYYKLEKQAINLKEKLNQLHHMSYTEEVPLEHPYHSGYYFEVALKPKARIKEKNINKVNWILNKSRRIFYKSKVPDDLINYNVFLDETRNRMNFFPILSERQYKFVPEDLKSENPRFSFLDKDALFNEEYRFNPYSGERYSIFTITHEFKKLFYIKRSKRIITHRKIIYGEFESEEKKLNDKLYNDGFYTRNAPNGKRYWEWDWHIRGVIKRDNKRFFPELEEENEKQET